MKFKDIKRSGVFAWSPNRSESSIAIATTTQQFDSNSGSDLKLEIHGLDLSNTNSETCVRASTTASANTTFKCIAWHSNHVICGTQQGTLQLYGLANNKLTLASETPTQNQSLECVDLNPLEGNVLATGSNDGTLTIWDINSNTQLTPSLTLRSTGGGNEEINCLQWNKQVKTIFASASNSNIYVWDIRKRDSTAPIMRVRDSNTAAMCGSGSNSQSVMISRSLAWSHAHSTTLLVANSNDSCPILQMWDLRYATCPIKTIKGGHSRGIVSVSWNSFDEELLLTAGKDNSVCLWNPAMPPNEEPLLAVLPSISNQWINDIQWCNWDPSLFCIGSFDGNTSIYNITKTNSQLQANTMILESFALDSPFLPQQQQPQIEPQLQSQQQKPILAKPPKWYRAPCRASWAFGGKLITYSNPYGPSIAQQQAQDQDIRNVLSIYQVLDDVDFVNRAEKLENALNNENLMDFCRYKIVDHDNRQDETMSLAWRFVLTYLDNDEEQLKENVLKLLGYVTGEESGDFLENSFTGMNLSNGSDVSFPPINGQNLFPGATLPPPSFVNNFESPIKEKLTIEMSGNNLGSIINRSILIGDVAKAIDRCVAENAWSEAILLCCFVAPSHTASVLKKFFAYSVTKQQTWSSLLWCIVTVHAASGENRENSVFQQLVSSLEVQNWKEAIAFIIRECRDSNGIKNSAALRSQLIEMLAEKLLVQYETDADKKWLAAAMYCYILTGSNEKLSNYCSGACENFQDMVELLLILQKTSKTQVKSNRVISHYAQLLAKEGKLVLALKYIQDYSEDDLKDRIVGNLNLQQRQRLPSQPVSNMRSRQLSQSQQSPFATQATQFFPQTPINQNVSLPPNAYSRQQPKFNPVAPVQPFNPNSMANIPPPNVPQNRAPPSMMPPNGYTKQVAAVEPSGLYGAPYAPPAPIQQYQPNPYSTANYPQTATPSQVQLQNVPSGWNDPPPFKPPTQQPSRHVQQTEMQANLAPISMPAVQPAVYEQPQQQQSTRRGSVPKKTITPPPVVQLSPENQQLYNSFERLFALLQQNSQGQGLNVRRKIEDVRIKLETMKFKLADTRGLSIVTIQGLNDIANAINCGDYHSALISHTNLVASTTFSETASFLPALKVMLHLAQQIGA